MEMICLFEVAMIRGYKYIFTIAYYFSKWAEVISVPDFTSQTLFEFFQIHIIYRFSIL